MYVSEILLCPHLCSQHNGPGFAWAFSRQIDQSPRSTTRTSPNSRTRLGTRNPPATREQQKPHEPQKRYPLLQAACVLEVIRTAAVFRALYHSCSAKSSFNTTLLSSRLAPSPLHLVRSSPVRSCVLSCSNTKNMLLGYAGAMEMFFLLSFLYTALSQCFF